MLYLIRHGQTDWNKAHKLQGTTDIPLNETGRQMAGAAKAELDGINVDICYVSPLSRAVETAEILLEGREVAIIPDERLKEISFGIYEGTLNFTNDPENPLYPLFHDPAHYQDCGKTESFASLNGRTKNFLDEIVLPLCEQGKNVLVVAHGALNLSLYNQIYHIPLERFWDGLMKNCEIKSIPDEDLRVNA